MANTYWPTTVLLSIYQLQKDLSDALDWSFWIEDAGNAIKNDKPPRTRPTNQASDIFLVKLQKQLDVVATLNLKQFEISLPPTENLPTSSLDAIRLELRDRVFVLLNAISEHTDAATVRNELKHATGRADLQVETLISASAVLGEAAKNTPDTIISRELGMRWAELELTYIPQAKGVSAVTESKLDEVSEALRARGAVIRAAAAELRNALAVEEAALSFEAARLRKLEDDYAVQETMVKKKQQELLRAHDLLQKANAEVRAVELDLVDYEGQISGLEEEYESNSKAIRRLRADLERPYDLCPQGNSYGSCTHLELKNGWDAHVRGLKTRLAGEKKSRDAIASRITEVRSAIEETRERLANAKTVMDTRQYEYDASTRKLQTMARSLAVDRERIDKERWQSRADIHQTENRADGKRIADSLLQME